MMVHSRPFTAWLTGFRRAARVVGGAVHAGEAVAAAATEDGDLKLFCLFSWALRHGIRKTNQKLR